jgi:hypothetical protein
MVGVAVDPEFVNVHASASLADVDYFARPYGAHGQADTFP